MHGLPVHGFYHTVGTCSPLHIGVSYKGVLVFNQLLKQQIDLNCSLPTIKYKIKTALLVRNDVWDHFAHKRQDDKFSFSLCCVCFVSLAFLFVCFACFFNVNTNILFIFISRSTETPGSINYSNKYGTHKFQISVPITICYDYIVCITLLLMCEFFKIYYHYHIWNYNGVIAHLDDILNIHAFHYFVVLSTYTIVAITSILSVYTVSMTLSNGNIFRVIGHLCGGIHRSPVNSPHKGQLRGALMFSLICVWINDWVNNREAGDLRRYPAHYDVTVIIKDGIQGTCKFVIPSV